MANKINCYSLFAIFKSIFSEIDFQHSKNTKNHPIQKTS